MKKSAKEDFIELVTDLNKVKGLDELSSRIIGILFVEPTEISLDSLSKKTGYSLSSVCTAMKFLERSGLIKRIKKPKSRKVYFYMEKNIMKSLHDSLVKKSRMNISIIKERAPIIIEKYKTEKTKESEQELQILKNYYKQALLFDEILKRVEKIIQSVQKETK